MSSSCYIDGYLSSQTNGFSSSNYSLHYGSAIFEGIRSRCVAGRATIFRLQDHVERFFNSAKLIDLPLPIDREGLIYQICQSVKCSGLNDSYIRPIAYFGEGLSGLLTDDIETFVSVLNWAWTNKTDDKIEDKSKSVYIGGYRKVGNQNFPVHAKASSHYLNSRLAALDAIRAGHDDALLCDSDGYIAECSASNVFFVCAGKIVTPTVNNCLPGITRDTVIQLINFHQFEFAESRLTVDDIMACDEAFTTSTAAGVTPVIAINGKPVGNGEVGPLTQLIAEEYSACTQGQHLLSDNWQTII